jgi:hypothetical protein
LSAVTSDELERLAVRLGSYRLAYEQAGLSEDQGYRIRKRKLSERNLRQVTGDELLEIQRLRSELVSAKRALSDALDWQNEEAQWSSFLERLRSLSNPPPAWTTRRVPKKGTAVPMAVLSDVHYGEVVNPREIEYLNAYSHEIANLRLESYFHNLIHLAEGHIGGVKYEGFMLLLAGDMLSGEIHDELTQTNQLTSCECVHYLKHQLARGLNLLAEHFGRVHVCCVVGNHPRLSRKPQSKQKSRRNLDWLLSC